MTKLFNTDISYLCRSMGIAVMEFRFGKQVTIFIWFLKLYDIILET